MKRTVIAVVALVGAVWLCHAALRKPEGNVFYVYADGGSRLNHFCPSGWEGSYGDLHFNPLWQENPLPGTKKSIQVKYSAQRKQNDGWAGIVWVDPCNSWGEKVGGFDLTGFKKLKFSARGETGKEVIDKFFFGTIAGDKAFDSDGGETDRIDLAKSWKTYEIDLAGKDLSSVVGGFGVVFSADNNPEGATVYLSDIRYSK